MHAQYENMGKEPLTLGGICILLIYQVQEGLSGFGLIHSPHEIEAEEFATLSTFVQSQYKSVVYFTCVSHHFHWHVGSSHGEAILDCCLEASGLPKFISRHLCSNGENRRKENLLPRQPGECQVFLPVQYPQS